MRHIRLNVLLLIVMGISSVVHSQVSELDNNSFTATDYLGWDASTLFDLNVEHRGDYQIWMSTNGARRMLIDDGNTGNTMGRIGIGNSLPSNFSPRERVHIFQGTGDNLIRFTNNDTGFDSGFDIGIIDDDSTTARLRQFRNAPVEIWQHDIPRFIIQQQDVWNGLNGESHTDVTRVTLGHNEETDTAWSMLHFWEGGLTDAMRRDWFNIGTSYTGNTDFMYTGLLERPLESGSNASTDAVIAWGCQNDPNSANIDNFRILFIKAIDTTPEEAAETQQGLEVLRITPWGNVGIGDYSPTVWDNGVGLGEQPTHKLDVDGTARLRKMVYDTIPQVLITGFEVDTIGDYELRYVPLDSLSADCDWVRSQNTISLQDDDVVTGIPDGSIGCVKGNVGIGTLPKSKLDVLLDNFATATYGEDELAGERNAIHAEIRLTGTQTTRGVYGENFSEAIQNYGGSFRTTGSAGIVNVGVRGEGLNGSTNIGVLGVVDTTASATGTNYAGFFIGDVGYTGVLVPASDIGLKQDVQPLSDANALISQLQPMSYRFLREEYPYLNLPSGERMGLIAQDVQEVLPNLVKRTYIPEQTNEDGEVLQAEMEYLGVNYLELIPLLIQGMKEQQDELAELRMMIGDLELGKSNSVNGPSVTMGTASPYELYQNRPNPFSDRTEIIWRMAEEAQATIRVQDQRGAQVAVLLDGTSAKGLHSLEWDASGLPAGTYFYSLEVNTQLMVKRAVKLEH